jgi:hypothetical protein
MDCKTTFPERSRVAMTLPETMVAIAIGSIVALVLAAMTLYSARNFSSMANYTDLNDDSRIALDYMSKEIRQSRGLLSRSPNSLVFNLDKSGTNLLSYTWDKTNNTLTQVKSGISKVLLPHCTFWTNSIFQRNLTSNSFDLIATSNPNETKLIQLQWICARARVNATNSESVQSMKIVIRKKTKV